METIKLVLESVWKILLIGLILGAGLPALFAVGVRGLAIGNGHEREDGTVHQPNPLGNVLAAVAFLIVIAAIVLGILIIVSSGFGMKVSFEHIYPTLVDK
ncbi:hypothetical protein [Tsukamurella spumae]|uniref:Uncharacterized protein n=1 Tax=Tsukamurella spumae TaxID=44753 RepID=A0A846WY25_9ACTN|nr:hypothetical protein [Tsukamurella spumae]NKY17256.1 hypothetical protein [Tsukamurella spumae]